MAEMPLEESADEPPRPPQAQPKVIVRNFREPIRLTEVRIDGVLAEAAQEGQKAKVWTRHALTSDHPLFHEVVESLSGLLTHLSQRAGKHIDIGRANDVLLVIRPDQSAELWVDGAAVSVNILLKRSVRAGEIVFERDIADVTGLDFPCVEIGHRDKLICLFRQDWRFAVFFDFNPDDNLSRDETVRTLGTLYRRLRYRHLYDMIADETTFSRLIAAGWFPFVEIIGNEFKSLAAACRAGFPLANAESKLMQNFDKERLNRILERWIAKPSFKPKEALLKSAINAYTNCDPVAVLKIVLTEIEGILSDAYFAKKGSRPKIKQLLEFARESAEQKAGAPDTLLFPIAFARYLDEYTYAEFDPRTGAGEAGSRHAVGHGAALAESYTQSRALQALLTLDQFAFYV